MASHDKYCSFITYLVNLYYTHRNILPHSYNYLRMPYSLHDVRETIYPQYLKIAAGHNEILLVRSPNGGNTSSEQCAENPGMSF